ncbi:DMT family transporter [Aliiroseovarius subalbicans]|uniref:DMT family transporter n=1 Tax=Aliiroseovarius subalbicans TaxID=2925840 RepID=UPI001F5904A4|nr:DMT family transporter [Aliiroseovarius subalbicans]MCI2398140.1 DMT family transporter [Aliiroseovarius subalbicans]
MNTSRAILLKLASVAGFVSMASLIKAASDGVPPGEAVFFRSLFAIPVILLWLKIDGNLRLGLRTKNPLGHLWRGLVGTTAMGLNFSALGLLPLPEVTAIFYAAPILTVIFAAMFLGEQVRAFRLTAVALGMVGVLIILSPRLTAFSAGDVSSAQALGAMFALTAATFAALAKIFVRKLVATEHPATIVFYFSLTATTLSLVTLPFGWVVPSGTQLVFLVLAGIIGGVSQGLLTTAFRHADASMIAPFDYASMLLALTIGYFVFDEVPTGPMLAGAGIVIAAGILIIWRERQLGLDRKKGRQAMTPGGQ